MPRKIYVVNVGRLSRPVPIINQRTSETDEVLVQPGGKPYLPVDCVVDPTFLQRTPEIKQVTQD